MPFGFGGAKAASSASGAKAGSSAAGAAKVGSNASAVKAASNTPSAATIKAASTKEGEAAGLSKQQQDQLPAESERVAGNTPAENKTELSGKESTPDPIAEKPVGTTKEQKDANAAQEKTLKDKLKSPAGIALIAALGLTIALVTAFIVKAAEAAAACTDCRDFKITITSIKPTPSTIPLIGGLFKPSTVDVSYSCPTNYEPLEGKESFTFKDTGFPELDGQTFTVDTVLGKNKVQVKCGGGDCSGLDGSKGTINPNCADFSDRFNDQVEKAGEAAGGTIGSAFKGIFKNMGTALFVIGICVLFYFLIQAVSKS
jgi:hypothetical protein